MATNITGNTRGVFIISVTPFTDGGSIDWASVDCVTEFYLCCGVNGITILGMMGEAPSSRSGIALSPSTSSRGWPAACR